MDEQDRTEPFRAGDIVGGRYRIVRRLGEGGMGRVYLADDLRLAGQQWALKWVPRDGRDPMQPEKEAAIMTSLKHPSLPRIVDYLIVDDAGYGCLVMDYLEGETLLQRSAAHGHSLPWTTVVHYGAQLCDLLGYLHTLDSPIVFRDVKPSNVIVGPDDSVRLIDFGIARTFKEGKASDTVHVGSVGFAAPELLANRQTDHRADLYSLGSLLYFLLSGGQFYNFTKRPIEEWNDALPEGLLAALRRLLAENPEERFPNASAAKEALLQFGGKTSAVESAAASTSPTSATGRRCIVTVYGLFPKAGATFLAAAIAKLASERRRRTSYVAFPWAESDGFLRMLAETKGSGGEWRDGDALWQVGFRETGTEGSFDVAMLYKTLFETKSEVAVFDVPSSAPPAAAEALFRVSDVVVAVAAPDPGGLRSVSAADNWRRLNACAGEGRVEWVANRMPEAVRLPDFYKLFSVRPAAIVPEFPYERNVGARWSGKQLIDEADVREQLAEKMAPLLDRLAPEPERPKKWNSSAKRWLAKKWSIDYNKDKFHP